MPATLVNETLKGINQGVSQQFTEARRETQVEEMINCIPSVSRGVLRRNPVGTFTPNYESLLTSMGTSKPFIYAYDRGTGEEQYVIIIGENGKWVVINSTTGQLISTNPTDVPNPPYLVANDDINPLEPRDRFEAVTIADTTYIINKTVEVALTDTVSGTLNSHLDTGVYWFKKTTSIVTVSGTTTESEGYIYMLNDTEVQGERTPTVELLQGDQLAAELTTQLNTTSGGYLSEGPIVYNQDLEANSILKWNWSDSFGNEASYGFKGQTRDTSLLPDKMPEALGRVGGVEGTGTIVRVTGVTKDSIDDYWMEYTGETWVETREPGRQNEIDGTTMPHVFRREADGTFSFGYNGQYFSGLEINEDSGFKNTVDDYYTKNTIQYGTDTGYVLEADTYYVYNAPPLIGAPPRPGVPFFFIYFEDTTTPVLSSSGAFQVGTPYLAEDGYTYEVSEAVPLDGVHYEVRRYIASDGFYQVFFGGDLKVEFEYPLEIDTDYLGTDGYYYQVNVYDPIAESIDNEVRQLNYFAPASGPSAWSDREVGDLESNPDISFVGKKLQDIFFYKNRLGLITLENIILSELSYYNNFWPTSVRFVPDDDSIDLAIATTNITTLRSAVATNYSLILFSDEAQYVLESGDEPLTPTTAYIETASKYNYSDSAHPKGIGNQVLFVADVGSYSQLYAYRMSDTRTVLEADNITAHIPSYIKRGISSIVGHSVLGQMFFLNGEVSNELYVYNYLESDTNLVQSAFHTWSFEFDILGIFVINNELYLICNDYYIYNISLEVPGEIDSVVYQDRGVSDYDSEVLLSRWHVRDENGLGTKRGRLQIRTVQYSIHEDSYYQTTIVDKQRRAQVDPDSLWILRDGVWDDTRVVDSDIITTEWDDDSIWIDGPVYIPRTYQNDEKVTVMGNAETTEIAFGIDPDNPSKGFELHTLNYEGLLVQRSKRI